jgi:hypothetical protein
MIIEKLENILSEDFNTNVVDVLKCIDAWRISDDEKRENMSLSDNYSDSGLLINSYNQEMGVPRDDTEALKYAFLNVSASHVFRSVLNNSGFMFHNVKVLRHLWNYYNKASNGVPHRDNKREDAYSMIYYLNHSDGGTFIDDVFFKSVSGNAVIFKANTVHRGSSPKIEKNRFVLNILFTADSYERK